MTAFPLDVLRDDAFDIASNLLANDPRPRNAVLQALPNEEIGHLRTALHPVRLVLRQVLHEQGAVLEDVYFVESGLVSLIVDTRDASQVEVGMIGREGLVGTTVLLNPNATAFHRAVVQMPGSAWRIRASFLRDAVATLPVLRQRCLLHVQAMMIQTAQAAACNARHELPSRLARWLLMAHDRADGDELPITQEGLSAMLGVRRAGVSVVASTFETAGLIRQYRGRLAVLDRDGLESRACSCYRLVEGGTREIEDGKRSGTCGPAKLQRPPNFEEGDPHSSSEGFLGRRP